jgi:membrane-bound lytic murein transglycosylase D
MLNNKFFTGVKLFGGAFFTGILVFFLISTDKKEPDTLVQVFEEEPFSKHSVSKTLKQVINSPNIPETVDFCGEPVPVYDKEVYERLDKELIINSHLHGSTLLILKKSYRYFPMIERILKEEQVPEDMKYLCVAESALSHAISSSGATGFWQFMKDAGQEYGLEINSEIDERYDIEKSTRAACKYLKDSKKKFGTWTMAAAAYNGGNNGLNRRTDKQSETSYYDLHLNQETSRYVFRIIALKLIIQKPTDYGFYLTEEDMYKPYYYKQVKIKEDVEDWAVFAKSQGITYKTLKHHNFWIMSNGLKVSNKKEISVLIPHN